MTFSARILYRCRRHRPAVEVRENERTAGRPWPGKFGRRGTQLAVLDAAHNWWRIAIVFSSTFLGMYNTIHTTAVGVIPFCWFPLAYIVFQVLNVSSWTGGRDVVYQTAISSSFLCFVLLLACSSSVLRQKLSVLFRNTLNWQTVALWVVSAAGLVIFHISIPRSFTTLYEQLLLPILGLPWILLQGYAVLRLALLLHSSLTSALRTIAGKRQQTVAIVVRSKGNGSTQDAATVRTARLIAVGYGLVFAGSVVFACWPWWSGRFSGALSQCIMLTTLCLSAVLVYYSARWEVNRGLLIPAAVIFYVTTLVINILLDSSADQTGGIAAYAFANSIRVWMVFTVTMTFFILKYDDFSIMDMKEGMLRFARAVLGGIRARCMCWRRRHSDNKRDRLEDMDSSDSGMRSSSAVTVPEQQMDDSADHADVALLSEPAATGKGDSGTIDIELGERKHTVSGLEGKNAASPNSSSPGDYLAVHYFRMIFLVNYVPVMLADWLHDTDGEALLGPPVYMYAVHLLGWVGVCTMYFYAMYCVYTVNHKYAAARRALFTEEFGHSRTAEVLKGDDEARSPGG